MHAEHLVIDQRTYWQEVEALTEVFPKAGRSPPLAFVVEPVKVVDLRGLVIAPQQEEVLGVFDLVGQ